MTTIRFTTTSYLTPTLVLDALTDFSERRLTLWPNIDREFFRVDALGTSWADVMEGSSFLGGVWWQRRYDWSEPGVVRINVCRSNAFDSSSFSQYEVTVSESGGSRVDATIHRVGRTLRGRLLTLLLSIFGRRILRADLERTLARMDHQFALPPEWQALTQ